ncbi:hypothetical protein DIURU_005508 [Diutina rugosa]|uniref:Uncharacterized protein n=1 Tax=Diutina rugosa TaxID=5481 RepID=A0A642UD55_DIURU|nr:uncharacterized protein DIURU_005508 [Diutina rugosa]KAA8896995.1 hypothetical protein DIURU_005508 [Diutina rugosa]
MLFSLTFEPSAIRARTYQFVKRNSQARGLVTQGPSNTTFGSSERSSPTIVSASTLSKLKSMFKRKRHEPEEPESYVLPEFTFDHRISMVIDIDTDDYENSTLPVEYLVKCDDNQFVRVLGTNQKTVAQNIAEMALDELKRSGIPVDSVAVNYINGDITDSDNTKLGMVPGLTRGKKVSVKPDDTMYDVPTSMAASPSTKDEIASHFSDTSSKSTI